MYVHSLGFHLTGPVPGSLRLRVRTAGQAGDRSPRWHALLPGLCPASLSYLWSKPQPPRQPGIRAAEVHTTHAHSPSPVGPRGGSRGSTHRGWQAARVSSHLFPAWFCRLDRTALTLCHSPSEGPKVCRQPRVGLVKTSPLFCDSFQSAIDFTFQMLSNEKISHA